MVSFNSQTLAFVDNIERLRSISYLDEKDWLDMIEMNWKNYQQFKMGLRPLSNTTLDNLSEFSGLSQSNLLSGNIDFKSLAISLEKDVVGLPESYLQSSYSRRRTTITSIEFIEKAFGWRLKQDVLNYFKVRESALQDHDSLINVKLITQISDYLRMRQFSDIDFFMMGAYSAIGNKNSLLDKTFKSMNSVQEVLNYLINELTPLFEINSTYSYTQTSKHEGIMTMRSVPEIADELGVKHLGNPAICILKSGICASAPSYIGLPFAKVVHTSCEHRGDDACRFHIDMSRCYIY